MTISTTQSRISYNGNGATTAFSFPYLFFENSDLVVILTSSAGVDTTQVLNTDYTLTGAANPAGGTVTMLTAPASGERLTIYRSMELTQETDYITGDPFPAESHERALDRLTMISQQLQEELDRSAKLPVTSTADADTLVANIITLAAIEDDVSTVAGISSQVTTVAGNVADVNTVAGISGQVTAVAGNAANINAVAANQANIDTVATNIADVQTVAVNISDIQAAPQAAADAEAARDKAQQWAEEAEDVEVDPGQYSAYHWAQKAEEFAAGVAENISFDPTGTDFTATNLQALGEEIDTTKQDTLVSGTNIKTVNGREVTGSGDVDINADTLALFNAVGSTPVYACRAWVFFDATRDSTGAASTANTNRFIYASGNVASVLRTAASNYQVSFTTDLPDANYSVVGSTNSVGNQLYDVSPYSVGYSTPTAPTSSGFRAFTAYNAAAGTELQFISLAVFR